MKLGVANIVFHLPIVRRWSMAPEIHVLHSVIVAVIIQLYEFEAPRINILSCMKQEPIHEIAPNNTLVIVMGSLRGGEYAWHSMYQNLLDLNQADLALAVGYNPEKNSSLYSRAKYVWEFEEYDDWADALDLIASEYNPDYEKESNNSWRNVLVKEMPYTLGGACGIGGSGGIIFWIRWFISHKIAELKLLNKYDRFVVTRSDHYYLCEHNLTALDPTEVWVPEGEEYGGITDRHVVAPAEKILQVLDILPPVLRH